MAVMTSHQTPPVRMNTAPSVLSPVSAIHTLVVIHVQPAINGEEKNPVMMSMHKSHVSKGEDPMMMSIYKSHVSKGRNPVMMSIYKSHVSKGRNPVMMSIYKSHVSKRGTQ